MKRNKWQRETKDFMVGELVLILQDYLPPLQWRLGRIKFIHPGSDGHVRVVTLESEGVYDNEQGVPTKRIKEFLRPISKIARLPIEEETENIETPPNILPKLSINHIISSRTKKTSSITHKLLPHMWIQMFLFWMMIKKSYGQYDWNPSPIEFAPLCSHPYDPLSEIPDCTRTARFFVIEDMGSVCSRQINCFSKVLSRDGKACIDPPPQCSNRTLKYVNLDSFQCQRYQYPSNAHYLQTPEIMADYCDVGGKQLKNCEHFTTQVLQVPIIIVKNVAYPVKTLNIVHTTIGQHLGGYNCSNCKSYDCLKGLCNGDATFCKNFICRAEEAECQCRYDRGTELFDN